MAREIGLTKLKSGMEIRDASREDAVVREAVERARSIGLDEGAVTSVIKILIDEAVKAQLDKHDAHLAGKRALVIGAGRMGAWTARFLSNRGATVCVYDPRGALEGYENIGELGQRAKDSDIAVVAGPLGTAADDLRELLEAGPGGIVFDLCSVKAHISATLTEGVSNGFKITSVHPMFGPGSITPRGQNVIVCSCGCPEADTVAKDLFGRAGAVVTEVDLEEHDRLIAQVLGAPHLCALVFGLTVSASGASRDELASAQGPSFATLSRLTGGISNESRRVYHDIQRLNPHTERMIAAVDEALRALREASLADDPAGFAKIMEDQRKFFGGWS